MNAMFNFKGFICEFITSRNILGNISISVYADNGVFLYQLTDDVPFPLAEDLVVFKEAPFVFQFLAQLQNEGILVGGLERRTIAGKGMLLGKVKERKRAATL